jgi:uncharacterized OB-fold protein
MTTVFHTGLPASAALTLQRCGRCQRVNYPPRELCGDCLADDLQWRPVADTGVVQSLTRLDYSLEPGYARHLPWTVASVLLDCGPIALAHLAPDIAVGSRVRLRVIRDQAGNRMLAATGVDPAARQAAQDWLHSVGFTEIQA